MDQFTTMGQLQGIGSQPRGQRGGGGPRPATGVSQGLFDLFGSGNDATRQAIMSDLPLSQVNALARQFGGANGMDAGAVINRWGMGNRDPAALAAEGSTYKPGMFGDSSRSAAGYSGATPQMARPMAPAMGGAGGAQRPMTPQGGDQRAALVAALRGMSQGGAGQMGGMGSSPQGGSADQWLGSEAQMGGSMPGRDPGGAINGGSTFEMQLPGGWNPSMLGGPMPSMGGQGAASYAGLNQRMYPPMRGAPVPQTGRTSYGAAQPFFGFSQR